MTRFWWLLPQRRRTHIAVLLFFPFASFLNYFVWQRNNLTTATSKEIIETYRFPQNFRGGEELPHLTPVEASSLIPRGSYPIDVAHRNAYLHTGHCVFIMDASGLLLFLKRSPDVVTCPNTWSILGEHTKANENPFDTVARGIEEELGLKHIRSSFNDHGRGAVVGSTSFSARPFTADFQTIDNSSTIHITLQNITEHPLYYIRYYGTRLDNRIDSQVTSLWLARLPKRHEEIQIKLDDEVSDHKWISVEDFSDWIEADATEYDDEEEEEREEVAAAVRQRQHHDDDDEPRDDGPPKGDFCHHTIRSLYARGLDNLKKLL